MKKLFVVLIALTMGVSANAQYVGNKLFDNMQFGIKGGAITPIDEFDMGQTRPEISLELTKYITPVFGVAVEGTFGFNSYIKNAKDGVKYDRHALIADYSVWTEDGPVDKSNVSGLAKFNILNIWNYDPERKFDLVPFAGIGWGHIWHNCDRFRNVLTFKIGSEFNVNLNDAWQINIVPDVVWDRALRFNSKEAYVELQAGVTYKFMTSNGTRHFVKINACDHEAELARLNARIAELEARKPVVKEVVKEVTKEVVKTVATETAVWFDFDSAELTEEAKANLDKIATDKDLTITGYASPEGRKDYNLKLSERRAQAVADYLKSKGAKVTTVDGKGVADYSLFRVVTVK